MTIFAETKKDSMKRIALFTAFAAAVFGGCKAPQESAPSALDVIMTRTSVRNFTGEPVSQEQLVFISFSPIIRLSVMSTSS